MGNDPIVGIDLGTSNSVVAYCGDDGMPRVLADGTGAKIQPSVVSFHPSGAVVIGAEAKQRKVLDPRNTIYSVKRLIGRTFRAQQVQTAVGRMPYVIKEGQNQQPVIVTRAGEFSVPEISAIVLDHLHGIAGAALGDVSRAVVTVPANFNDAQRSATATAGAIAGLTVVRVLNEPTAAALAYGHDRQLNQTIAVYDFGGGTFDVTILRLADQVFEVLGTAGDSFLGGDDLDERIVDQLVAAFLAQHRLDLRDNEVSMMRLRAVAEQVKIELSRKQKAIIRVDEIAYGPGGAPIHLHHEFTRDQLVAQVADIVDRTFPVCQEALKLAGVSATAIEDVVLVGGSTKMPYVRDRVAKFFGRLPRTDVNPEEAVAVGASLQAAALERVLQQPRATTPRPAAPATDFEDDATTHAGNPPTVTQPMPRAPSAPTVTGPPPRAPTAAPPRPSSERAAQRGAAVDRFVPPPPAGGVAVARITRPAPGAKPTPMATQRGTAVASGSAPIDLPELDLDGPVAPVGGAPLAMTARGFATAPPPMAMRAPGPVAGPGAPTLVAAAAPALPQISEVTPRGLGIATIAGYCEELIRRNARLPAQIKKQFTTSRDAQRSVRILICTGDSRRITENVVLGDLVLENLPSRPRGETSIEVTFAIDASGILNVSARDVASGQEQRAALDIVGALSAQDVEAAKARVASLGAG